MACLSLANRGDRRATLCEADCSTYQIAEENPMAAQFVDHGTERSLPGFWLTLFTILFPVVLMLVGSWADGVSAEKRIERGLHLIGNDDLALLIECCSASLPWADERL